MAGDWIKVEHVTPNKPEVSKVSRILSITKDDAFGKMMRFWMWIDSNSVDGHVDGVVSQDVDDLVACVGFSDALVDVGWLKINNEKEKISIPNHERHNGKTAKNRSLKNKRQANWRSQSVDDKESTKTSTREEKRREEKKESKKKKFKPPTLEEVEIFFTDNGYSKQHANKVFNYYVDGEWKDASGKPVKAWKQKMRGNWFKDEGKLSGEKETPFSIAAARAKEKKLEPFKGAPEETQEQFIERVNAA